MNEHTKQLMKARNEATKRLRYAYHSEFMSLLYQVYEEMGITPKKRGRPKRNDVDVTND